METLSRKGFIVPIYAFYPTYEEWKLSNIGRKVQVKLSFYPTYEEWKPFMHVD